MNQSVVNEMFKAVSIKEGLLPLKVTPFYHRKIKQEVEALGNHLGPLHRVSFPTQDRLSLRAPNEVKDFVDDRSNAVGHAHKICFRTSTASKRLRCSPVPSTGRRSACHFESNHSDLFGSAHDAERAAPALLSERPRYRELTISLV